MATLNFSTITRSVTVFIVLYFSPVSIQAKTIIGTDSNKTILQTPDQNQTVNKLTCYKVKPGYYTEFQESIKAYVMQSLEDENNIMSEAYYEQEDTAVFWLIERWTNKEALKKHNSSAKAKALQALTEQSLKELPVVTYVKDLEPISKQQWRSAAKAKDDQLTIMLFVDAKPGTQDEFKNIYHKAMPEFRSEPGVVTYQLSQLQSDSTRFVTYEKFRSREAFQYHLNFSPILPVIEYLNTNILQPPFQKGLHTLIEFAPLMRE